MRTVQFLAILTVLAILPGVAHAALGDHQWSSGWHSGGMARADGTGHIAAAGTFFSAEDFGGGTLTPINFLGGDVFLARFDDAGNHVWSQQFTPGGLGVIMSAAAVAPDGTIYVAGTFPNGDIDFGGGLLSGVNEGWLVSFDSGGNHLWSFVIGSGTIRDLAATDGFLACTGYTAGSVDFGGGLLSSSGNNDMFVAAVNADGSHRFSQIHGAAAGDSGGMSVAIGPSDEIVVLASSEDAVDFGGGILTPTGMNPCLMEFDSNGAHQWSWVRVGSFSPGSGVTLNQHVAISSTGEVALVGEFENSVDMGGGLLTSFGSFDAFVACYDTGGGHLSSVNYGGNSHDEAHGVAFDSADNIAVVGNFLSPNVTLGGSAIAHSGGFSADFFAAIYDPSGSHLFSSSFSGGSGFDIGAYYNSSDGLLLTGGAGGGIDFGGGALAAANFYMATMEGANATTAAASPTHAPLLVQNSPNPFNPSTVIGFDLSRETHVLLEIFDARGRMVRRLVDGALPAGRHDILFDGRGERGRPLASGVYRYRLRTADSQQTMSMVLVK